MCLSNAKIICVYLKMFREHGSSFAEPFIKICYTNHCKGKFMFNWK